MEKTFTIALSKVIQRNNGFAEMLGNATKGLCVAADGSEYHISYKPTQRTGITKDNLQKMKLNDSKLYEKYATTTENRVFQVKKIVK